MFHGAPNYSAPVGQRYEGLRSAIGLERERRRSALLHDENLPTETGVSNSSRHP
jgi:hypothetical protein